MSKALVLGAAALALSAASASAQAVYPGYGYPPYGYSYAPFGYGYAAPAPLYDYGSSLRLWVRLHTRVLEPRLLDPPVWVALKSPIAEHSTRCSSRALTIILCQPAV